MNMKHFPQFLRDNQDATSWAFTAHGLGILIEKTHMKMTPEHKAALLAGRKASKIKSSGPNPLTINEFEAETLKRVSNYTPSARNAFLKAFSGKSRAMALKAKCIECCCYQKNEVAACQVPGCPLYRYRPYRGGAK